MLTLLVGTSAARDVLVEHYQMAHLDLGAGLPNNNVNQFFVDSQGFVWISTYGGGAVRYDGFSFMSIGLTNPQGLSSNSCKRITEDRHHRLWIAYDERTDVIDMRTMSSTTPCTKTGDISSLLDHASVDVYCDSKGAIWHVMGDSILRYTFSESGDISHISRYHYVGNTPDVCIKDIEQDGTVWACIDGGLFRLAERNGKLVREEISSSMSAFRGLYVTDMLKRGSKVWITTNEGLFAYDQYSHEIQTFRQQPGQENSDHSLSHNFTTSLAEAPDGRLMIGSLRGINILSEQLNTFQHWDNGSSENPLPSDFIHCMMVHDGQVWIGTETAGVVKLTPRPLLLRNYIHQADDSSSISAHPVNAMYVEPDGTLWVGTVEGGLNYKAVGSHAFEHFTTQKSGLSHNSVSALEADTHGQLWVATWGGGLNKVNLSSKKVEHVELPADMTPITNYIGALAYDKYNDALWIGSNDGVFYYDLKTGAVTDPFDGNRLTRGCIGTLIDTEGQLWMGCITGLRVIDLRSKKIGGGKFRVRSLYTKLDHPELRIVDKICCFCQTEDGTLWLGSNGYGLYQRTIDETGKETFVNLTTNDGLANNTVHGIVEDKQGRLWITTANGLSVYDPRARTFINYKESDGLLCQRFYWNSAVKAADGTIYLGSMKGLIEMVDENKEAVFPVHLTLTQLLVDNQIATPVNSDYIDEDISQVKVIRLHESNKSFEIQFSALTYAGDGVGHYSYRLRGFEEEWTSLPSGVHSVRYTALKPGNYTFEVKYNAEMNAAEEHKIYVQVHVAPYFWKSWWFNLLLVVGLIAFVVWFYRYKEKEWRREEAERLLMPIRKVLEEDDQPQQLQSRIQNILDNHEKHKVSVHKSVEADKQEVLRTNVPFMDQAMEIMEKNYSNSEFGIQEFADALGMSKSLVSKRLNAETGQSTGQFIRNYRLTIAKRLILENISNRNIAEIAYAVGFNDPKYFTRCFTREYGTSPSTYMGDEEKSGLDLNQNEEKE